MIALFLTMAMAQWSTANLPTCGMPSKPRPLPAEISAEKTCEAIVEYHMDQWNKKKEETRKTMNDCAEAKKKMKPEYRQYVVCYQITTYDHYGFVTDNYLKNVFMDKCSKAMSKIGNMGPDKIPTNEWITVGNEYFDRARQYGL